MQWLGNSSRWTPLGGLFSIENDFLKWLIDDQFLKPFPLSPQTASYDCMCRSHCFPLHPTDAMPQSPIEPARFWGSALALETLSIFLFNARVPPTTSLTGGHQASPCLPPGMGNSLLKRPPSPPLNTSIRQFFLVTI